MSSARRIPGGPSADYDRQRGAVLVFALLLLLVMTILGVSSIGNSVLEERMSGNFYQSTSALQAAETALRVGEAWLGKLSQDGVNTPEQKLAPFADSTTDGLYSTQADPGIYSTCWDGSQVRSGCAFNPVDIDQWCPGDCDQLPKGYVEFPATASEVKKLGTLDLPFIAMAANPPRVIIEYMGRSGEFVGNLAMGAQSSPDIRKYAFRITAIGWARDPNARYVLQSHFIVPL